MKKADLKNFLDEKVKHITSLFFKSGSYSDSTPIYLKEDIEISAFLTATIAWGNRKSIITNAQILMELLDNAPYQFVMEHKERDLRIRIPLCIEPSMVKTYNISLGLKNTYIQTGGMEAIFKKYAQHNSIQPAIERFKEHFFELPHSPKNKKACFRPIERICR